MAKLVGGVVLGVLLGKAISFNRKQSVIEKVIRNPDKFEAKAYVENEKIFIEIQERQKGS